MNDYRLSELNKDGLPSLTLGLSSALEWQRKSSAIGSLWLEWIGGLPERVPTRYEVLSSCSEPGHVRQHIRYDTAYGDIVTAYLLLPRKAEGGEPAPSPAVLALHPTADAGKDDISLRTGRENRRYALELAERGYVVLAPDTITAGERIYPGAGPFRTAPFYGQHPDWTAVGKMLSDHLHGLDLLSDHPAVDPNRIGVIGHSLGGYNAFFLAGADPRIRAVAVSCGLSTLYGDPDPNRWGQRDWFSHIPKLTSYLDQDLIPFDFNEIAALAAPSPFFCWIAQQDQYMPHWRAIGEAAAELSKLYEFLGHQEKFQALIGNSRHDFPEPIRRMAYEFLDRWLKEEVL